MQRTKWYIYLSLWLETTKIIENLHKFLQNRLAVNIDCRRFERSEYPRHEPNRYVHLEKVPQRPVMNSNLLGHLFRVHMPTQKYPECTDVYSGLLSGDAFSVRYFWGYKVIRLWGCKVMRLPCGMNASVHFSVWVKPSRQLVPNNSSTILGYKVAVRNACLRASNGRL